jgi:DNA repair exonuclease SbcCD nuclease subunit
MPENVYRFSTSSPETKVLEDIGVAIHGQGFATRSVSKDLTPSYPDAMPSLFNIGMLHTSLTGREGHETYAPCSVDSLLSKKYDYWALGHVHKREIVNKEPSVIFPGNTQGRNIRETGEKGCTVVTVKNNRDVITVHHNTDVLRWFLCDLNADGAETPEDILDALNVRFKTLFDENIRHPLAIRVNISGRCGAHEKLLRGPEKWTAEIEAIASEIGYGSLWIEKVNFLTEMNIDIDELIKDGDPLGELFKSIQGLDSLDDIKPLIQNDLLQLKRQLPKELIYGDEALNLDLSGDIDPIIKQVRQLLIARLLYR